MQSSVGQVRCPLAPRNPPLMGIGALDTTAAVQDWMRASITMREGNHHKSLTINPTTTMIYIYIYLYSHNFRRHEFSRRFLGKVTVLLLVGPSPPGRFKLLRHGHGRGVLFVRPLVDGQSGERPLHTGWCCAGGGRGRGGRGSGGRVSKERRQQTEGLYSRAHGSHRESVIQVGGTAKTP